MGGGSRSAPLLSYRAHGRAGAAFRRAELHTRGSTHPAAPPRPRHGYRRGGGVGPLAAEEARLALTRFKRTVVHAAHADEERAFIAMEQKNRQARAKIRKRRDVQFETFKFAQKRLSDNRDALQQLDERVRETNRLGLAKRRQIDDEAAAMAASQAQEMLIIDAAARASEEERRFCKTLRTNARAPKPTSPRRTRSAKIWRGSGARSKPTTP